MIKMKVRAGFGWWGVCWWVPLALVFAGCGTTSSVKEFSDSDPGTNEAMAAAAAAGTGPRLPIEAGTRIQVGDSLTVTFGDMPPPPLTPFERVVREDGTITLLHNQTFAATNKTTGELESDIHDRYVNKFYPAMTVTVTAEKNSRFYYVDGEVKHPDRFIYLSRTTVLKAIASAGGFTDFANKRKVTLTRLNGRTFTINCKKAIQVPSLDLEVFPGDRIFVKRAIFW
jgi:polysaccharide export outer membrane protein